MVLGSRWCESGCDSKVPRHLFTVVLVLIVAVFSMANMFVSQAELVWSVNLRSEVFSPASIGRDGVFVSTRSGEIRKLGFDGKQLARIRTGKRLASSPVVGDDGFIYLTTEAGEVLCYAGDGTLRWSYNVGARIVGEPAIGPSKSVYVATTDGGVVALSKDGNLLWNVETESSFRSAPSIWLDESIHVVGIDGKVYSIDPDRNVRWNVRIGTRPVGSPAIDYDGKLFVGTQEGIIHVLDNNGEVLWQVELGGGVVSEVVLSPKNEIYAATVDGRLVALAIEWSEDADYFTLVKKWERRLQNGVVSAPIVGSSGTVYVVDLGGRVYGFSSEGTLVFFRNLGEPAFLSGLTDDGLLIAVSTSGVVSAIRTSGDTLAESSWPKFRGNATCSGVANKVDFGLTYGGFAITTKFYRDQSDWDKIVHVVFGPDYKVADWQDLIDFYDLDGDLLDLFDNLGLTEYESSAYVTANGRRNHSSARYYFASRHEHELPEYYLAHDSIDDHLISLGSWYGWNRILAIRRDYSALLREESRWIARPGKLFWKFQTGDFIWSSPAIDEYGNVYVGSSDGNLYAFDPDGNLVWKFSAENSIGRTPAIGPDGTIYIGDESGNLYALSSYGELRWVFKAGSEVSVGPIIDVYGNVLFGSLDGNLFLLNGDGEVLETYSVGTSLYCEPAVDLDDGTIYFGDDNGVVYALVPFEGIYEIFRAEGPINSGFAIYDGPDGKVIYFVSRDGHLYAIEPDGTLRWKFELAVDDFFTYSSPIVGPDGTVYVGDFDGGINAISPDSELLWRHETGDAVRSTPLVTAEGIVYAGSADGYLYALTISGELLWKFGKSDGFGSSPTIGPNGVIYLGSWDGFFYAIHSESTMPYGHWPKYRGNTKNTGTR